MLNRKQSDTVTQLTSSAKSLENLPHSDEVQNSNSPVENEDPAKNYQFKAFFYVFLTSVFFTVASVFVKKLTYINPGQLTVIRNAGLFAGGLPIAVAMTKQVLGAKENRLLLLIRGFLGGIALYLNLSAFRYLPLAEAAILMSTIPSVTSIIAFLYLKEPCGLMQGISLILTAVGVLLSVRLPELLSNRASTHFDYTYAMGLASGVGCVLFMSVCLVILRKMKHVHFSVSILYVGFIGMVETAFITAVTATYESPRCGWDQIFVILIGVLGFIGHCTLTLAIQKENVGIVSILKASLDIIVAMVFQVSFFDEKLNAYNISGGCLVIVSVSLQEIRKWINMLPEESKIKKKLKLFLV